MRDFIWTLIIVWLIYKLVDVFKKSSSQRAYKASQSQQKTNVHTSTKADKDIKDAVKKHLNEEGEYVDFEEIK